MNTVKLGELLGELITPGEVTQLRAFVGQRKDDHTTHNLIMKFLDTQPVVMKRFKEHGVLKAYGAWLFEFTLRL